MLARMPSPSDGARVMHDEDGADACFALLHGPPPAER
jgi:hypothetical protein